MRLLITTQAVDRTDPVLGFFVRWIAEFAKHCTQVTVICLRAGEHDLPQNVRVIALGKAGKLARAARLLRLALRHQGDYDAVFVHMNPEYLVAAGWLWRLMGKRIGFWYMHKTVDLKLRVATFFAQDIFTGSPESFRLATQKLHVVGHGIDTDFFTPADTLSASGILSLGRLSPTKRHDLVLRAAALTGEPVRIAGDGPERAALEALAAELGIAERTTFVGGVTQAGARDEYRRARVFAHTSETGSLDKVVLEALACGLAVVTTSTALSGLPVERCAPTPEALAAALQVARPQPDARAYVEREHSLSTLVPRILAICAHPR